MTQILVRRNKERLKTRKIERKKKIGVYTKKMIASKSEVKVY